MKAEVRRISAVCQMVGPRNAGACLLLGAERLACKQLEHFRGADKFRTTFAATPIAPCFLAVAGM